nr:MAG TPA: hypothetical protein [Caudoviricetes sp.]
MMETIMYIALTVTAIAMAWMNYEYWKLNGYLKEMSIELENYRSHYEVVVIKRSKETEKILKNANLENKRSTLSFVTINQIVESILAQDGNKTKLKRNANEATIILKTAMIYEARGIDEAMKYYNGTHSEDEYQEFRTSTVLTD